ncbi:tetratricopeptide repeat-containing sensor histidine kinase [Flavihumibacter sp. UBA7668]|uniref:tetratricopeptide repeat-containing sensor histidine kinase n=1 Tax=Flavihumibacter sp. UBA7668 TaxID=1946542 RepID=UPI0025C2C14D|nr:tetratricopeptide repeat protein [Flavihumibacter sp. UBA7668]
MIKFRLISPAIFFCFGFLHLQAQVSDTNAIKNLYDQSLDYSEDRIDSLKSNAILIETASSQLGFSKGFILSNRLKGLAEEYAGNYEEAISWYLKTLNDARSAKLVEYEIAALSDLAITYSEVKQYEKARDVYRQSLQLSMQRGEVSNIISGLGNLGAIYNLLNKPDSALLFLEEGLRLSTAYNTSETLPTIYNNLGNVYFKKKDFYKALQYFRTNKSLHQSPDQLGNLWTDYLNIGDVYIELGRLDSARMYCDEALRLAKQLNSRSKEAESYSLLAKLYERLGQYRMAYQYQQQWYQLDTALVNQDMAASIAEMQERFNAKDREKKNQLLQAAIEKEKLNNRNLRSLSLAAFLILVLISIILFIYRNSNQKLVKVNAVINRQKESLSLLNQEKNTLISIVSHDLSTPFSSIHMWSRLLEADHNLAPDQKKATENIRKAAENGEQLIRHILEVEKEGTGMEKMELEEIHLAAFLHHLVEHFQPAASEKKIKLSGPDPEQQVFLFADQSLLKRIIENLVSNALKFSLPGQQVQVRIDNNSAFTDIIVEDNGPGISKEDQQRLFTKYGQLSARPTAGESSTGLGLAIVKRLANELNASLQYEGNPGIGSRFIIRFKK